MRKGILSFNKEFARKVWDAFKDAEDGAVWAKTIPLAEFPEPFSIGNKTDAYVFVLLMPENETPNGVLATGNAQVSITKDE